MVVATRSASWLLVAGGLLSAAIAALHFVVIFVGAPAYRYFGAGERLARLAESGSFVPALVTALIAAVFAGFAWYGLAGAGVLARPPLERAGLVGIATIFLLRGVSVFPQLASILSNPGAFPIRYFIFSAVSFLVGICYAAGTWRTSRTLRVNRGQTG